MNLVGTLFKKLANPIRPAKPSDTNRLVALWNTSLPDDPVSERMFFDRFFCQPNSNPSGYFVLEREEEIIGFIAATLSADGVNANIEMLMVHPRWQRRGLGSRLLGHLTRYARTQRRKNVLMALSRLDLFEGIYGDPNKGAFPFFEKRGFHASSERYEVALEKDSFYQWLSTKGRGALILPPNVTIKNSPESIDDTVKFIRWSGPERFLQYAKRLEAMSQKERGDTTMYTLYHSEAQIGWLQMNPLRGESLWSFCLNRYSRLRKNPIYGGQLFVKPEYSKLRLGRKLAVHAAHKSFERGFDAVHSMTSTPTFHASWGWERFRKFVQVTS